jgi:hypothetical protein
VCTSAASFGIGKLCEHAEQLIVPFGSSSSVGFAGGGLFIAPHRGHVTGIGSVMV